VPAEALNRLAVDQNLHALDVGEAACGAGNRVDERGFIVRAALEVLGQLRREVELQCTIPNGRAEQPRAFGNTPDSRISLSKTSVYAASGFWMATGLLS
jgi:hypothetical protein